MTSPCQREYELLAEIAAGRWPDVAVADLRAHVEACQVCRELSLVALSLQREAERAALEPEPPATLVWWRAQLRARHESVRAANRPISVVQALAIACGGGLLLGLAGIASAWIRSSAIEGGGWSGQIRELAGGLSNVGMTNPMLAVAAAMIVLTVVITPVALLALRSDR